MLGLCLSCFGIILPPSDQTCINAALLSSNYNMLSLMMSMSWNLRYDFYHQSIKEHQLNTGYVNCHCCAFWTSSDLVQYRAIHLHLTQGQIYSFSRSNYCNVATIHPLTVERLCKTRRDVTDHSTPRRKINYTVKLVNDRFNTWILIFHFKGKYKYELLLSNVITNIH